MITMKYGFLKQEQDETGKQVVNHYHTTAIPNEYKKVKLKPYIVWGKVYEKGVFCPQCFRTIIIDKH